MLLIYLFSLLSVISSHNHNQHHDCQEFLFCDSYYLGSSYESGFSHDSHIISLKERCSICDHISNCEPSLLDSNIKADSELFSPTRGPLFSSFYLHESTNTLNKSPPFS